MRLMSRVDFPSLVYSIGAKLTNCCNKAGQVIVIVAAMKWIRKIVVVLPVVLIGSLYVFRVNLPGIENLSEHRIAAIVFSLLLFYAWVIAGAIRRRQAYPIDVLIQAAYYFYLFAVLTLTGYFAFFYVVPVHGWWQKTLTRIELRDCINLHPFVFLQPRLLFSFEVIGNLVMLFPLGIFLPLLYPRISRFIPVLLTAMCVSLSIELMQLATNFRVADVDDVILNTSGACAGFIVYLLGKKLLEGTRLGQEQRRYEI